MEHWQETELEKLRREAEEAREILMGRLGQRQGKPPLTLVEAAREIAKRDETNSDIITSQRSTWKKAELLTSAAEESLAELDRLRTELKEREERDNPMNEALLRWAITQYQQGKLEMNIEVREVAT